MRRHNVSVPFFEQTGRTTEAEEAYLRVLQADAGDALGHAGKGWIGLRSGDPNSIHHFQEALRLDPTLEWAREELIQSLKARNPVFKILLRWFLWLSAQSRQRQRVIIFGGVIGFSALCNIARIRPEFAPFIWPILAVYLMFIFASWIGDPLFDTMLRFDKEGRAILTPDRIRASNCLVAGITRVGCAAIAAAVGVHEHMIFVAIALGFLLLPIAATFQVESGRGRTLMALLTTGIAITAFTILVVPESTAVTLLVVSVFLSALSTWISRWLSSRVL